MLPYSLGKNWRGEKEEEERKKRSPLIGYLLASYTLECIVFSLA
jgi:hypothetical protein